MQRPTSILALAALTVTLASCYGPEQEPRPFARHGARSLDNPPRYGGPGESRYMEQAAPRGRDYNDPSIDPRNVPPGADTTPPPGLAGPAIDPGLRPELPGTTATPPAGVTPPSAPSPGGTAATPPASTPPPAGDVPYARAVPGKPGYVYNPHDGKILDVTGMRPGTKVKDPQTGAMFRVP